MLRVNPLVGFQVQPAATAGLDPNQWFSLDDRVGALSTWNPADKNANLNMYTPTGMAPNTGVTCSAALFHKMIRGLHAVPIAAGKTYWEFELSSNGGSAGNYVTLLGAQVGGTTVNNGDYLSLGGQAFGMGYATDAAGRYNNGWSLDPQSNGILNIVHSIAYDSVAGKMWWGWNASQGWITKDPMAGTNPLYTRTAAAAPLFPCISMQQNVNVALNTGGAPWRSYLASMVGVRQGGPNCKLLIHGGGYPAGAGGGALSTTLLDRSPAIRSIWTQNVGYTTAVAPKFATTTILVAAYPAYFYPFGGTATDFIFGIGDFTIDFWFYSPGGSGTVCIADWYSTTTAGSFVPRILYDKVSGILYYNDGVSSIITAGTVAFAGVWNHVAVTRGGNTLRMFLNGVLQGAVGDTKNYTSIVNRPLFGVNGADAVSNAFDGYMEEIRILKGEAAWTSNFTPPTSQYT